MYNNNDDAYYITLDQSDIQPKNGEDSKILLSSRSLAKAIATDNFALVIDGYVNNYENTTKRGLAIGHALRNSHRTLQRSAVELLLAILCGISEQEWTDPRNETAIATAKKIKTMVENNDLPIGLFI